MERQLKERLIGAAVLIAAAVVLVPEIFSGSASRVVATDVASSSTATDASDSSATSGQLKTYHIQLQDHGDAAPSPPPETEVNPSASQSSADTASVASNPTDTNSVSLAVNSSSSSAAVSSSAPMTHSPVAAKTSEPKPAAATEPIKKAASNGKGWVVQIGSFGADAKAKQIVGSLKAKDYPAFSGPVTVKGKTLYRVRVGPVEERTAADTLLKQLKSAYPEASVVPQQAH